MRSEFHNGTNGIPISFKVLPMVSLVIPFVPMPMVPLATNGTIGKITNGTIGRTPNGAYILKRWAEHFNSVLNHPSSVNDSSINRLQQIECNVLLDEFPTVTETREAIQHLSPGKAPGTDAIPAEVCKAGGLPMAEN